MLGDIERKGVFTESDQMGNIIALESLIRLSPEPGHLVTFSQDGLP
jgi:hypothetical protein